jgi:hypothetical protein
LNPFSRAVAQLTLILGGNPITPAIFWIFGQRRVMDPSFFPTELVVKHTVNHRFVFELGESITGLNWKKVGHWLVLALAVKGAVDIVKAVLSRRGCAEGRNSKKDSAEQ